MSLLYRNNNIIIIITKHASNMSKLRLVFTFISTKISLLEECHHLIHVSFSSEQLANKISFVQKKKKNKEFGDQQRDEHRDT